VLVEPLPPIAVPDGLVIRAIAFLPVVHAVEDVQLVVGLDRPDAVAVATLAAPWRLGVSARRPAVSLEVPGTSKRSADAISAAAREAANLRPSATR
jgi:hypothetical protein